MKHAARETFDRGMFPRYGRNNVSNAIVRGLGRGILHRASVPLACKMILLYSDGNHSQDRRVLDNIENFPHNTLYSGDKRNFPSSYQRIVHEKRNFFLP